ncbi:MAG TPA: MFS transporter [Clostridiales bacterium]|nr:MFS transporter [Clostridiales bacterium]
MMPSKLRLMAFYAVTGLFWFSLYTYVPVLPTHARDLGATPVMLGLIVGSYGFAQMLLRIPFGILSDRLGSRKLFIIIGMAMAFLGAAGLGFSTSGPGLLISRFATGVAASAWVQFTVLYSSYYVKEDTPKAIGYINAICNTGQMTAMLLGGFAAARLASSPYVMAAAAAVIAFALAFFIHEKRFDKPERSGFKQILSIFSEKNLLVASGLAIFSQMATFATVFAFTPVHAANIGAGSGQLGLLTTLNSLPSIFASMLAGTLIVPRIGLKKTIFFGFVLTALSYILIPFTISLPWLYMLQFVGGAGRGTVMPLLMGAGIKDVSEKSRASAMGFFQAVYAVGMFAGPVISGAISGALGLFAGFWFIGAVSLLAGGLVLFWET